VFVVTVASASSVDSDKDKSQAVSGSGDGGSDKSADETLGIIGIGTASQRNCTLCAGAITQEVGSF